MKNIPESIVRFVALVEAEQKSRTDVENVWIARKLDRRSVHVNLLVAWQENYRHIFDDGGGCILMNPRERDQNGVGREMAIEITYPLSIKYMRGLFDRIGFGENGFGDRANGEYLRIGANTIDLVLDRRKAALSIFDEVGSESQVVLTKILQSCAVLKIIDNDDPTFLQRWGMRTWDFYEKHYKNGLDIHPVHSFTKAECLRLAKKHQMLYLGGYG